MKDHQPIIPYPMQIEYFEDLQDDYLVLDRSYTIVCTPKANNCGILLQQEIKTLLNLDIPVKKNAHEMEINLDINSDIIITKDAYSINIDDYGIEMTGNNETGLFYAIQTFKQLLFHYHDHLPYCEIEDDPVYYWRGLHLDVARHFMPLSFIKKLLDQMALLKLNRFHWHLTDDQGWRIESKKFPKLIEIGSKRNDEDGVYCGYYSQEQIKDLVAYAKERHIEIIPEIDMPGHTQAMIAAYPNLSCVDNQEVWNKWGVSETVLCMGKKEVRSFVAELLEEIIPLFPSPYFHIGGDECPDTIWKTCPNCQAYMKSMNFLKERELQHDFNIFLESILKKHNKQLIGWDEIMEGNLSEKAVMMCWRGDGKDAAANAVQRNRHFILCPNSILYFDWKQSIFPDEKGSFGVTTIKRVYEYDPEQNIEFEDQHLLLGVQANIWTEYMKTPEDVEYMTFPRILALAEIAWKSGRRQGWDDFAKRADHYRKIMKHYHIRFCDRI